MATIGSRVPSVGGVMAQWNMKLPAGAGAWAMVTVQGLEINAAATAAEEAVSALACVVCRWIMSRRPVFTRSSAVLDCIGERQEGHTTDA